MTDPDVFCTLCGSEYPIDGVPYHCAKCGGLYDFRGLPYFNQKNVDRSQPGLWRYRHTFGFSPDILPVSLGEGNTPLVWADVLGHQVAFKCEYLNPSGSFKDRGTAVIAAWLRSRGVTEAVEDSSGNAGASFAAYAARAGIRARIYVPESASGPKRRQIEAYGAELVPIRGSRADVSDAVRSIADSGVAYASHAYNPHNISGYATAAYEIVEQIGKMPGTIIVPTGQGGFLLGLGRGFEALRIATNADKVPLLIGVQAKVCAPLWAEFKKGEDIIEPNAPGITLAEGVMVRYPMRKDAVLGLIDSTHGAICAVSENEILPARNALARLGFYVEPTSAIIWPILVQMLRELPGPIVVILTGSGLKYG